VTIRVSLPAPLGQRNVYFNGDTIFLASHGKLALLCDVPNGAGCGIPSIPVSASCTDHSYQQAMGETAPPMHAVFRVLGCDGAGWCSAWAGPAVPPGAMARPAART
jgi:hypothetical protein